jgi:hypothetical protein
MEVKMDKILIVCLCSLVLSCASLSDKTTDTSTDTTVDTVTETVKADTTPAKDTVPQDETCTDTSIQL